MKSLYHQFRWPDEVGEEDHPMDVTELVTAASKVLSEEFGKEIRLRVHGTLRGGEGNIVLRVDSLRPIREKRSSFIVKAGPKTIPRAQEMLLNDWAALDFLGKLRLNPPLCPRLFGGNSSAPFIVMEDLGVNSVEPAALLDGSEPDCAEAGLISYMKCLGQLHSASLGKSDQFWAIRDALGAQPAAKPLYHDPWSCCQGRTPAEIGHSIGEYKGVLRQLEIEPDRGVDEEIDGVTNKVEACPGQHSAFCQGDQNGPAGCLYIDSGIRLIDFGACGFRYPLIEGMPHRLTWGCTKRIPKRLYACLEKSYQSELAKTYSDAADDALFRAAMMYAAARWNIFHTIWRIPDALQGDRPRGATSLRQQVVAWLNAFVDMTEEFNQMPALGNSARRLLSRLRALWPPQTHTIPCYSAFKNG